MELKEHSGKIYLKGFSFEEIANKYGTPFYLYDLDTIKRKIAGIRSAFNYGVELLYAVKANSNLELLRAMKDDVDGLDIASVGEMEQALLAGYDPGRLSFAGPGKTRQELKKALQKKIGIISVESMRELNDIKALAIEQKSRANILLRINPKLLIKEFAIKMGGKATQFGIDEEDVKPAIEYIRQNEGAFNLIGIHIYAGTQCMTEEAIAQNVENTLKIASHLLAEYGLECQVINVGGGFGVSYYEEDREINLEVLSRQINKAFDRYMASTSTQPRFILELGRYLVAEAGIYVARVISEKKSRGEIFFVLDGGMNHHLAASGNLGATIRKNYSVKNLSNPVAMKVTCNLVGPLCTPLDLMGKGVFVESPRLGDLIGFLKSGSYGFTASPLLFLGHATPVELMVIEGNIIGVRERKTIADFN